MGLQGELWAGGMEYDMDFATAAWRARQPAQFRKWPAAAEAAGGGAADEQPLAPYPLQPESPPALAAAGEGRGAVDGAAEDVEGEMEYRPGDSTMALMYENKTRPDVYVGMARLRHLRSCSPRPPLCRLRPWGVVNCGTASFMRPRASTSTASRAVGSGRRRCLRATWSACNRFRCKDC